MRFFGGRFSTEGQQCVRNIPRGERFTKYCLHCGFTSWNIFRNLQSIFAYACMVKIANNVAITATFLSFKVPNVICFYSSKKGFITIYLLLGYLVNTTDTLPNLYNCDLISITVLFQYLIFHLLGKCLCIFIWSLIFKRKPYFVSI